MKNLTVPIGIFFAALLAGVVLVLIPGKADAPVSIIKSDSEQAVLVESPIPGEYIDTSKPVLIAGKARGMWYFEASFPIEIKNSLGVSLTQGHAEAQGEWMTTEFVPFIATLGIPPQPTNSTGTIVLKKDNPSGDPERDASLTIPVVFK